MSYRFFMFIRKLKYPNGSTYIQVIHKNNGKYRVLKSFGSVKTEYDLER
jgi:hypothetical protein